MSTNPKHGMIGGNWTRTGPLPRLTIFRYPDHLRNLPYAPADDTIDLTREEAVAR